MVRYKELPELDGWWIFEKIKALAGIGKRYDGREFGSDGEIKASEEIEKWMKDKKEIGLSNVRKEKIEGDWSREDDIKARDLKKFEDLLSIPYIGPLNRKRCVGGEDWYLKIKVYDKSGRRVIKEKKIKSFPFLMRPPAKRIELKDLRVVEKDSKLPISGRIVLFDVPKYPANPHGWGNEVFFYRRMDAFILINDEPDTIFMDPSVGDGRKFVKPAWPAPGFSISGKDGAWIREQAKNHVVKADILSQWKYRDVPSYNVIGEIEGKDKNKVCIICAHYDCWWNQGVIDEAAETALVLGIAKCMKENNIKPKYTTKFIAFGGEEWLMRGSKAYVKKHVFGEEKEKIVSVFNPGNFGSVDIGKRAPPFEICSNNPLLKEKSCDIAKDIKYKYGTKYPHNVVSSDDVGGEDCEVFKGIGEEGVFQFCRWPYVGYHRDGNNHSKGDVIDILDSEYNGKRGTFEMECEMVWAIIYNYLI